MELEHFESLYPEDTRFSEIEKILTFIKEGNSCQLVSLPGAGRSSLLGLLAYNKKVKQKHLRTDYLSYHFVYINFSEIRNKPLVDAIKFIFLNFIDSLKERGMTNEFEVTNKIFKESLEIKDEMVIFSGLKKTIDYLALEKNLNIILLFDRFEEYINVLESEFFANLKILRNRAKYKFSVIFSLNRPLEDVLEPVFFADFYDHVAGKIIYMSITDEVGLDFRLNYLEKITNKKLDANLIQEVYELTGGHSNLTRLSAECVLSAEQKFDNKLALRRYLIEQKPIRSVLFGIWNSLTPQEQNLISTTELKLNSDEDTLQHLNNVGLIKDGLLTISILGDYVKEKNVSTIDKKLAINEFGEITKDNIVVSDKMTSLEFKLLKFLLQNKEKILNKEEIINAVWGDQKTTLGVTDQALDQLIFRLRKKIEDNPNSPKHIVTIKGRGFKLLD